MKKYDVDVQPQDVVFDRLAIWARILALPNRLMNSQRGVEIAKPIGLVKKVVSDALGRCWGGFMRVRVEIKVHEPLVRYVTVFSSKLQSTDMYQVQYEKLPYYCFSCGLLGHSALSCATPAERDEKDELPYAIQRLSPPEESARKMGGSKSSASTASVGVDHNTSGSKGSANTPASFNGDERGKGVSNEHARMDDQEVSSPLKGGRGGGRGRGRGTRGRGRGSTERELFPQKSTGRAATGTKRKAAKAAATPVLAIEQAGAADQRALVVVDKSSSVPTPDGDAHSSDSNKKCKTIVPGSADQAAAVEQPRQTQ
jgi:hypothetical protein